MHATKLEKQFAPFANSQSILSNLSGAHLPTQTELCFRQYLVFVIFYPPNSRTTYIETNA